MRNTVLTLLLAMIVVFTARPAHADRVHLINGDVMTGYIRTLHEPGGLDFRVNNGHVFNIPWSNVAGVYDNQNRPINIPALNGAQQSAQSATPPAAATAPMGRPTLTPPPGMNANGPIPLNQQGVEVAQLPQATQAPQQLRYAQQPRLEYASSPFLGTPRRPALRQWPTYEETMAAQAAAPAAGEDSAEAAPAPQAGWLGAHWDGRANIGASLQTGNTENNAITADVTLKAKWEEDGHTKHRATVKAEYNREEDDGDVTEDNRKLSAMYDWFFAEKWFLNTNASFEQDDIDEIDLRTIAGLGLGHQPFESEELNLQYVLGPSYLHTNYENGDSEDSLAARWALDYDQYYFDKLLQGFHEHEILVPVDDTDAFLFDSKTGLRLPIRGGIVGTAEVDFEWDNKPEPGIKEDDTTYAVKLGYEW